MMPNRPKEQMCCEIRQNLGSEIGQKKSEFGQKKDAKLGKKLLLKKGAKLGQKKIQI